MMESLRSLWRRFFGPSFVDYSEETSLTNVSAPTTDTNAPDTTQEEAPFDWQRLGPHVQRDREPVEETTALQELADRIIEQHLAGVDKLPAFPVFAQRMIAGGVGEHLRNLNSEDRYGQRHRHHGREDRVRAASAVERASAEDRRRSQVRSRNQQEIHEKTTSDHVGQNVGQRAPSDSLALPTA